MSVALASKPLLERDRLLETLAWDCGHLGRHGLVLGDYGPQEAIALDDVHADAIGFFSVLPDDKHQVVRLDHPVPAVESQMPAHRS
jgi:hypothetical protein